MAWLPAFMLIQSVLRRSRQRSFDEQEERERRRSYARDPAQPQSDIESQQQDARSAEGAYNYDNGEIGQ